VEEAREKLEAGLHIMIRQGTGARNLEALLPLVDDRNVHRFMLCTDDRHPHELMAEGHIAAVLRDAIRLGRDPLLAIRMVTLNPADYFGLRHLGAIAPGRQADLVVFRNLKNPHPEAVYHAGVLVAEKGSMLPEIPLPAAVPPPPSMHLDTAALDFSIPADGPRMRVIQIVPAQIVTRSRIVDVRARKGFAEADPDKDLLKIAVVERHRGTGHIGKAFAAGFGFKEGALASSVAHDSHNIIVIGDSDADMKAAVCAVALMGGGMVVVSGQTVRAALALPIAGLMSTEPVVTVRDQLNRLIAAARKMGASPPDPFMTLSFMALPVIPQLKITDRGLCDVDSFQIVSPFLS
jgi:adenine deaminase